MKEDKNRVVSKADNIDGRQNIRQLRGSNDRATKESFDWLKHASNEGNLEALNLWQEINTKNYMLRKNSELNSF